LASFGVPPVAFTTASARSALRNLGRFPRPTLPSLLFDAALVACGSFPAVPSFGPSIGKPAKLMQPTSGRQMLGPWAPHIPVWGSGNRQFGGLSALLLLDRPLGSVRVKGLLSA